jgi:hypothetical protein
MLPAEPILEVRSLPTRAMVTAASRRPGSSTAATCVVVVAHFLPRFAAKRYAATRFLCAMVRPAAETLFVTGLDDLRPTSSTSPPGLRRLGFDRPFDGRGGHRAAAGDAPRARAAPAVAAPPIGLCRWSRARRGAAWHPESLSRSVGAPHLPGSTCCARTLSAPTSSRISSPRRRITLQRTPRRAARAFDAVALATAGEERCAAIRAGRRKRSLATRTTFARLRAITASGDDRPAPPTC